MTVSFMPAPLQFFDNTGAPLSGGLLYTYLSGTTTPTTTYTDSTGLTPNANPVVLDSAGRANVWFSGFIKLVLMTSASVPVWTLDNVSSTSAVQILSALTFAVNEAKGLDVASASTTPIGAATGNYVNITGTNTIAGFDAIQAGTRREVTFTSSLTLMYNATSMILPGGGSIVASAGDCATFISLGSGNWICTNYQPFLPDALIKNLSLAVDASVNKLNIASTYSIGVQIPNGNGNTCRTRNGTVLGGSSQFILADATAYWGAVSGTDKYKLHTYEIWDAAHSVMVPALSRYAGFLNVPTTTTATDDDYFLLADGSTYTRAATDFCICTGHVWANYNTANTPDWTFYKSSDSAGLAPTVEWNPKSDYARQVNLSSTITQASDIAEASQLSVVVKQSGRYWISATAGGSGAGTSNYVFSYIKTGSATYGSATYKTSSWAYGVVATGNIATACSAVVYLNAGDTIHLGVTVVSNTGNRSLFGDNYQVGMTNISFTRID